MSQVLICFILAGERYDLQQYYKCLWCHSISSQSSLLSRQLSVDALHKARDSASLVENLWFGMSNLCSQGFLVEVLEGFETGDTEILSLVDGSGLFWELSCWYIYHSDRWLQDESNNRRSLQRLVFFMLYVHGGFVNFMFLLYYNFSFLWNSKQPLDTAL